MSNWRDILELLAETVDAAILITVGHARGSVPRESGATMLVTSEAIAGSIGGGRLEFQAIQTARELLADDMARKDRILSVPLGPELAQCCGGHVDILISKLGRSELNSFNQLNSENKDVLLVTQWRDGQSRRQFVSGPMLPDDFSLPVRRAAEHRLGTPGTEIISLADGAFTLVQSLQEEAFRVVVYGAGHVGRQVVGALAPLPCHLYWMDERPEEFPQELPANVDKIVAPSPIAKIPALPADAFHLVMTHSHQRDLEICEALLRKSDEAYIGLIGSATKKAKFRKRLALRGYSDQQTARINCPIGLDQLSGKRPAEIAVSVAADILIRHQQRQVQQDADKTERA